MGIPRFELGRWLYKNHMLTRLHYTPLVHTAGFEPARIAPPELESGALDHSAKYASVA